MTADRRFAGAAIGSCTAFRGSRCARVRVASGPRAYRCRLLTRPPDRRAAGTRQCSLAAVGRVAWAGDRSPRHPAFMRLGSLDGVPAHAECPAVAARLSDCRPSRGPVGRASRTPAVHSPEVPTFLADERRALVALPWKLIRPAALARSAADLATLPLVDDQRAGAATSRRRPDRTLLPCRASSCRIALPPWLEAVALLVRITSTTLLLVSSAAHLQAAFALPGSVRQPERCQERSRAQSGRPTLFSSEGEKNITVSMPRSAEVSGPVESAARAPPIPAGGHAGSLSDVLALGCRLWRASAWPNVNVAPDLARYARSHRPARLRARRDPGRARRPLLQPRLHTGITCQALWPRR